MTLLDWITSEVMAAVREENPHPAVEDAFETALEDRIRAELPPDVPGVSATEEVRAEVRPVLPRLQGEMVGILKAVRQHGGEIEGSEGQVAEKVAEGMRQAM